MSKKNKQILFAFFLLFIFGILVVFFLDIDCIFKSIFGIACPGCGLTRGFRALFSGHIIKAESYNILTVPIFLFLSFIVILFMVDIITHNNYVDKVLKQISNHYVLIIIVVCISWITNIIRGV